jgi:trans-aconitate 2-methyltransferase
MPTWNAEIYLRFADERTRPCRELAARLAVESPRQVIDLGCGPGNSTQVLVERWPNASIVGLDSSREMIDAARRDQPIRTWVCDNIAKWATADSQTFDIIFSNAALQWVPNHPTVLPQLLKKVAIGGAFAMQVPGNMHAPAHQLMRELANSSKWQSRLAADGVREWHVLDLPAYYEILAPHAGRIDAWETEYLQVLPSAEAIVDWYRGTGLRPFLDALSNDEDRDRFAADYLDQIRLAYPTRPSGQVLFPFRRLFVIAYR